MNERKEGASPESLTPIQKLEENVAKLAESKGLKLVVAQSNVEGTLNNFRTYSCYDAADSLLPGFLINHIHAARFAKLRKAYGVAS